MRTYRDKFKETGDPIALMQAFTIAMKLGIYPPVSILQALNKSFQRVIEGNGTMTLDSALGLKRQGKGAWTAFTDQKRKGQQLWLAVNMDRLIEDKGLTIAQAAEQVSLLTESLPTMQRYSAEALSDQYSRKWKKQFQDDLAMVRTFKPLP
jgi:hypothetical protein